MNLQTIELITALPVATIRLNRPERMNAVSEEMYILLAHETLRQIYEFPEPVIDARAILGNGR